MKRKNIFVIITITVILLAILLVYLLLRSSSKLNDKHISINFEIHNCPTLESNTELLRSEFIKPLLTHTVITENNGLENLYLTKVSCDNISFSIPALGINSFRYKNEAASLKESLMTSISRKKDEESFFNNWSADGYSDLEKILLKGHPKHKKNDSLVYLSQIVKSESDELIPDSVIIDKTCQKEQPPFLFSSTANFRKFVDDQLKKNKNAIYENGKTGNIEIFIWCGEGYNVNPEDRDNDGVLNEQDNCPDEPGEKTNSGCPKKNDDEDEVDEIEITTNVDNPSESNKVSNVCLGSDRQLTWDGEIRTLKIRITSTEINDIIKEIAKHQTIPLSDNERENLTQINPKRTPIKVEYYDPKKRKYMSVDVKTGSDKIIHCYNILP
jgi:hypothetical protein